MSPRGMCASLYDANLSANVPEATAALSVAAVAPSAAVDISTVASSVSIAEVEAVAPAAAVSHPSIVVDSASVSSPVASSLPSPLAHTDDEVRALKAALLSSLSAHRRDEALRFNFHYAAGKVQSVLACCFGKHRQR